MDRKTENLLCDIIENELHRGVKHMVGKFKRVLDDSDLFNKKGFHDIKTTLQKEMNILYTDIKKKMDQQEDKLLWTLDLRNPSNQEILVTQCEKAVRPIEDQISNLRQNIQDLQQSLTQGLHNTGQRKIPKQECNFKLTTKVPENIISLNYYFKLQESQELQDIQPISQESFRLQRKNGTYHNVIGIAHIPMTTRSGMVAEIDFIVIKNLHGNAYVCQNTAEFLSR